MIIHEVPCLPVSPITSLGSSRAPALLAQPPAPYNINSRVGWGGVEGGMKAALALVFLIPLLLSSNPGLQAQGWDRDEEALRGTEKL